MQRFLSAVDSIIENKYFIIVFTLVLAVLAYAKVIDMIITVALILAWLISVIGITHARFVSGLSPSKRLGIIVGIAIILGCLFYFAGSWINDQNQINSTNENGSGRTNRALTSEPILEGGYYHAYCYNKRIFIVLFYIKNIGRDASAAQDFKLKAIGIKPLAPITDPKPFLIDIYMGIGPNNIDMMLYSGEFIEQITKIPIIPGNLVRGWLIWEHFGCPASQPVSIEFTDVVNHLYSVSITNIQEIPPLPPRGDFEGYPNISYPFIEREVIKKSATISNLPLIHILN